MLSDGLFGSIWSGDAFYRPIRSTYQIIWLNIFSDSELVGNHIVADRIGRQALIFYLGMVIRLVTFAIKAKITPIVTLPNIISAQVLPCPVLTAHLAESEIPGRNILTFVVTLIAFYGCLPQRAHMNRNKHIVLGGAYQLMARHQYFNIRLL